RAAALARKYWASMSVSLPEQGSQAFVAAMRAAVLAGDELLALLGSWHKAVHVIRRVWREDHGNHLAGAHSEKLEGMVSPELLEYIRRVSTSGVPSRTPNRPTHRVQAEAHNSAKEHIDEVLHKIFKIASKGRILLCSSASEPYLEGVISTPMGRVPKLLTNRTVSPDGRLIHDQRYPVNELGSKFDHPPAKQPFHRQVARTIFWLQAKYPGLEVLLSKLDVDAAFQNIPIAEDDVCEFATQLPGAALGIEGDVIALYLVLGFVLVGSPGEYQIWGTASQQFFQNHSLKKTNGTGIIPSPTPSSLMITFTSRSPLACGSTCPAVWGRSPSGSC
ncbi:MAG: hypothetical protein VYC95_08070, partial [Verrucomicrobiota bacterium]|nr:hypothetical protein [Verrucomicrobiota bacterium]